MILGYFNLFFKKHVKIFNSRKNKERLIVKLKQE